MKNMYFTKFVRRLMTHLQEKNFSFLTPVVHLSQKHTET